MQRIAEWVLRRIKEWDQDINFMSSCQLVYLVRDGTPNGRRLPRRPHRRWRC